jgi:hypothetical protein
MEAYNEAAIPFGTANTVWCGSRSTVIPFLVGMLGFGASNCCVRPQGRMRWSFMPGRSIAITCICWCRSSPACRYRARDGVLGLKPPAPRVPRQFDCDSHCRAECREREKSLSFSASPDQLPTSKRSLVTLSRDTECLSRMRMTVGPSAPGARGQKRHEILSRTCHCED